MKKAEIQKRANAVLKENPDVDEVFATSDGQIFLTENAANLHKNFNAKKKKLSVASYEVSGKPTSNLKKVEDTGSEESPMQKGKREAKELKEKVATATQEELDVIEKAEVEGKNRKSIIKAIGERKAVLTPTGAEKIDTNKQNDDK